LRYTLEEGYFSNLFLQNDWFDAHTSNFILLVLAQEMGV